MGLYGSDSKAIKHSNYVYSSGDANLSSISGSYTDMLDDILVHIRADQGQSDVDNQINYNEQLLNACAQKRRMPLNFTSTYVREEEVKFIKSVTL